MVRWIAQALAVTQLSVRTIPQRLGSSVVAAVGTYVVLLLEDVQDPGNVGTLIRSCAWFRVRDLIITHSR